MTPTTALMMVPLNRASDSLAGHGSVDESPNETDSGTDHRDWWHISSHRSRRRL